MLYKHSISKKLVVFVTDPVVLIFIFRSVLTAVEAHYKDPSNPYPDEDNQIMFDLTPYLESAGINDPLSKVCCDTVDPKITKI